MRILTFVFLLSLIINSSIGQTTSSGESGQTQSNSSRPDVPGELLIDLGFNFLLNTEDSVMNTGFWGSKVVNFYYLKQFPIGKTHFTFNTGIGVGLEKFSFDNRETLAFDDDGNTIVVGIDQNYDVKKSKIAANYVDIPLELRYYLNQNKNSGFMVGIGGKIGYLFDSHTKLVYREGGERKISKQEESFNLSRFRYGLQARLGFAGVHLHGFYALNELFEEGKSPDGAAITKINVGITVSGF